LPYAKVHPYTFPLILRLFHIPPAPSSAFHNHFYHNDRKRVGLSGWFARNGVDNVSVYLLFLFSLPKQAKETFLLT